MSELNAHSMTTSSGSSVLSRDVASSEPFKLQVHELGCSRPPCEDERALTMEVLGICNPLPDPDPELESILKITNSIFGTPTATITLLKGGSGGEDPHDVVYVKDGDGCARGDYPWRWAFCTWITQTGPTPKTLVVPDAEKDARFSDNPHVVGENPWIKAYAGAPLVASNGHRLGTLCVCDNKARDFDAGQCAILNNLSEMVVRHLEKEQLLKIKQSDNEALKFAYKRIERALDCFENCVVLLDTSVPGFKIVYANEAWDTLIGLARDKITGHTLTEVFEDSMGLELPSAKHRLAADAGQDFAVVRAVVKGSSLQKLMYLKFRPASSEQLDEGAIPIGVPRHMTVTKQTDAKHLYFMAVHDLAAHRSASSTSSTRRSSRMTSASFGLQRDEENEVEGLIVGRLIGRGSYGSVYSGDWFGSSVAVKVIENPVGRRISQAVGLEVSMSTDLRHPHIVATLKSWTRVLDSNMRPLNSKKSSGIDVDNLLTIRPLKKGCEDNSPTAAQSEAQPASTVDHLSQPPPTSSDFGKFSSNQACDMFDAAAGSLQAANQEDPAWPVISMSNLATCDTSSWLDHQEVQDVSVSGHVVQLPGSVPQQYDSQSLSTPLDAFHQGPLGESGCIQTWMIMEFCDRGCLQDALDRGWLLDHCSCVTGRPRMEAVMGLAFQISSALQYLHSENVMHGDLSAWNILLTSVGAGSNSCGVNFMAKVADFGLARDITDKIQTQTYGTITHQPPETLLTGTVSKAVDVYAFGVLMWQLYTGSQPWRGFTHAQIMLKVTSGNDRLRFPLCTPIEYEDLALACMAFNAEDRPTFDVICEILKNMQV
ncbi:hypothetical protein CEUSTIGMA_g333.t1 [Chlamydomonas eustigma]|uniref:Protein kinase domain-containing protein n=1 Tax=Chlamydomonas eustigma TaxID=1157962 RepID=A0A250WPX3_9CHLO|nr:hypothetical protein CEUSTIGMA_g333.t1 [Chlamydomonas eustigma]|eukprot:GAX72878.1 hypothetical protein CEUSTIGMA_g333.t1 [Chlamydomonas eustigma]